MKIEKYPPTSLYWENYVKSLESWSFFYLPDWYVPFTGPIREAYIEVFDEKVFLPLLERRFPPFFRQVESGPFGGYGGVLGKTESLNDEELDFIVKRYYEKARYAYIALHPDYNDNRLIELYERYFEKHVLSTHMIDLSRTEDEIFEGFTDAKKRNIKRAQREKLYVKEIKSDYAIRKYYLMYLDSLRRWNAKKIFKLDFFKKLLESDLASLYMVQYHGDYVAGAIILKGNTEAVYWHGAAFQRYFQLRPNDLLHWEIMRSLKSQDILIYNMGSSNNIEGVERFKKGYGGVDREYLFFKKQ